MKIIQHSLTLLSITVLLFVAAAPAQTATPLIRASIPFDFQVGSRILPAGDYSVVRAGPYFLTLRDTQKRIVATILSTPAQALAAPQVSKLVFRVDGGRNTLIRVWTSSSRYGYELPIAKTRTGNAFAKAQSKEVQVTAQQ